jgi:Uma2 family endonuclease
MCTKLIREAPLTPHGGLGPYRRRHYDELPDEPRCELLFGRLYADPSRTVSHQAVVSAFVGKLLGTAKRSRGRAFIHLDVCLADHSVVRPDAIYITAARLGIVRTWVEGAPDLVIEVVSPDTARRDLGEKLSLYAQFGVQEYWIVQPQLRWIHFLVNEAGRYVVALPTAGSYQSQRLPELRVQLAAFWRRVTRLSPPATAAEPETGAP